MYQHNTTLRVRYGETDQMGYVYHGNYAQYFEVGREEAMRNLGSDYDSLEKGGVMMPVISLWTKYYKPAHYDEVLEVVTTIKKMPNLKMKFDYEIYNTKKELICIGHTSLVFVSGASRKPIRPPKWFLDLLRPFFTESADVL